MFASAVHLLLKLFANKMKGLLFLAVSLGVALYPHRLSIFHTLTGNVYMRSTDCGPMIPPKMDLHAVRECSEVDKKLEPCIMRNVVSPSGIEEYLNGMGDYEFPLRRVAYEGQRIGNPLHEPVNNFGSSDRLMCSMNDIMNEEKCSGYFTGFKALNFSEHLPLNSSEFKIEDFIRSDLFIGNPINDQATTTFHSNSFEESHAMQLVGEKVWLLMKPEDYFTTFQAYSLGAYNAAFNICPQDLGKVEIQAVVAHPGDALSFPKSWTHHIYTRKGPNLMINFRNNVVKPWLLRDLIAFTAQLTSNVRAKFFTDTPYFSDANCKPETSFPTNYGRGHPIPSVVHKAHYDLDMRCSDLFNPYIIEYKRQLIESFEGSNEFDADIYQQVLDFLHL